MARTLGGLVVSDVGLGCMGMSTTYGRPDTAAARETLQRAIDAGVTLFDTADMYGNGHNERFVGASIASRRDEIVLATKTGILTMPGLGLPRGVDARPERIRLAVDASLRRLGTDRIDLFYLHRVDPEVPVEDSIGALAEAVAAGKVRYLGLSEAGPDEIRRAHATHPIAALQTEWSLFAREIEHGPLAVARQLGIGIVPYSPLGRGMLTGSVRATTRLPLLDYRRFLPRWRRANLASNLRQVEVVREVAEEVGVEAAQVALAWLLARGDDVVPIPGTTRVRHLESNLGSLDVRLSPEQLARLDAVEAAGARYRSGTGIPGAQ